MTESELILQKALVASDLDSSQWNQIQAGLRNRAFFSSRIAEVRILDALRLDTAEYAEGNTDLSKIRMQIREKLQELSYSPEPGKEGTIHDLYSQARLDVIVKTNVAQARGYMQYLEGTSPGAFAAFPAQEFTRILARKKQREDWPARWRRAGGKIYGGRMIALKDDPVWVKLSVFGNPFPPFDWGSGMGVMDVDRRSAIELGLIDESGIKSKVEAIRAKPPPDFNANLQAAFPSPSLRSDSLCGRILRRDFGDQVKIENGVVSWEGNLVQDLLAGRRNKVNLGAGYNGKTVSLSHQFFVEHGGKHLDPNEPYEHLVKRDFELVPCLWRKPDRILPTRDPNRDQLELDTFDGWTIVMVVDGRNGLKSIQKRKSPGGSAT